ncbi:MAG: monovalent cation:proton antiporter family protein [Anaerolineae bacterium]
MSIWLTLGIFTIVAISAKRVGQWFSAIGLPYITGYLLIGTVAGPFVFGLLPKESTTDLRFIDDISLAVIAFVAGSELYYKEIRSRLRTISSIAGSVILVAAPLGGLALFFLTPLIPFTQGMTVTERLAVAILGSTILLALSPPSTIAVIKDVRAKGDFTRTMLGVTISMDVIIIVLFAVAVAIASAMLTGLGFSLAFAALLLIDLGAAIIAGFIVGKLLEAILAIKLPDLVRIGLIVLVGYGVFASSHWLTDLTRGSTFELHIEPLLVALIGGFYITNFTQFRGLFEHLLHDVSPIVYVAFFTLTGVGIKLDILGQTWPIALALFAVRSIGIYIGGWAGSKFAGESEKFTKYAGLALITQAGIALGLAREVAVEFPDLGDAFATMVISVIVINEVVGPMFLKEALKRVGETNLPAAHSVGSERNVLVLGVEPQSLEFAAQLKKHDWQVIMVDTDKSHVMSLEEHDLSIHHLAEVSAEHLSDFLNEETDAVVAMLGDDSDNEKALELAYKQGVPRLIVRPTELANSQVFAELGALVVDPASAMVNLFEQTVRAPQNTSMLLGQDSGREVVQVTVSNGDIDGMLLRDLRLPQDVLFMSITRAGNVILPNGYTRLQLNDDVTIVGRNDSLNEAMLKIGY